MLNSRKSKFISNGALDADVQFLHYSSVTQQVLRTVLHLAEITKRDNQTKYGFSSFNMTSFVLLHLMIDQMINENLYARHKIIANKISDGIYDADALRIIKKSLSGTYVDARGKTSEGKLTLYANHIGAVIDPVPLSKMEAFFDFRDMVYHADITSLEKNQTPEIAQRFMDAFDVNPSKIGENNSNWAAACLSNSAARKVYVEFRSSLCPLMVDKSIGSRCRFKMHHEGFADIKAQGLINDIRYSARLLPSNPGFLDSRGKNALWAVLRRFADENGLDIVDAVTRQSIGFIEFGGGAVSDDGSILQPGKL